MYQRRNCVFETNSSSTHSIVIAKSRNDLKLPEELTFKCGDFGWQVETYRTTEEKASYLYSSIIAVFEYDKNGQKKIEEYKNKIFDMLEDEGIKCSFEQPKYHEEYHWLENVSVDHAGDGDHLKFIEETTGNKNRLFRYLFSDRSFVWTGNDNEYCFPPRVDYKRETYYKGN